MKKVIAAILVKDNLILIAKRKSTDKLAGKWEFPGGKLEEGETEQECLIREMKEEFDIEVSIGEFFAENIYHYGEGAIDLQTYWTTWVGGDFVMNDHDEHKWVKVDELLDYDFLPADIPILEKLMRNNMVELQLVKRGITNQDVLESMSVVPRHLFVPLAKKPYAYLDTPLQIGENQTISQPYIVALMIQALEPLTGDKVLEIGTGSGYSAAVLSRIVKVIHTVERHESLAEAAKERLEKLGYNNIHIHIGDGTKGWQEEMPYDKIIVAAGGPQIPNALKDQLRIGGKLVIPVGEDVQEQILMRITRETDGSFTEENLTRVRFVPLIGEEGWE